jgi:hypothetical protein
MLTSPPSHLVDLMRQLLTPKIQGQVTQIQLDQEVDLPPVDPESLDPETLIPAWWDLHPDLFWTELRLRLQSTAGKPLLRDVVRSLRHMRSARESAARDTQS